MKIKLTTSLHCLTFIFFFTTLTNCSETSNNNRVIKVTDLGIKISSPDTILTGQELLAKIYLTNDKYKLIFAHVSCNVTDTSMVDSTLTGEIKIKGCIHNLMLVKDTVKIYFEPNVRGRFTFQEITLLAKGPENKYYSQNCTFDYVVK